MAKSYCNLVAKIKLQLTFEIFKGPVSDLVYLNSHFTPIQLTIVIQSAFPNRGLFRSEIKPVIYNANAGIRISDKCKRILYPLSLMDYCTLHT